MVQLTISPDAGVYVYVPAVLTGVPFTDHVYIGVPPFTGIGVKVTGDEVTQSTVPGVAARLTDGITTEPVPILMVSGAD
jgi:hypothetical protein